MSALLAWNSLQTKCVNLTMLFASLNEFDKHKHLLFSYILYMNFFSIMNCDQELVSKQFNKHKFPLDLLVKSHLFKLYFLNSLCLWFFIGYNCLLLILSSFNFLVKMCVSFHLLVFFLSNIFSLIDKEIMNLIFGYFIFFMQRVRK